MVMSLAFRTPKSFVFIFYCPNIDRILWFNTLSTTRFCGNQTSRARQRQSRLAGLLWSVIVGKLFVLFETRKLSIETSVYYCPLQKLNSFSIFDILILPLTQQHLRNNTRYCTCCIRLLNKPHICRLILTNSNWKPPMTNWTI